MIGDASLTRASGTTQPAVVNDQVREGDELATQAAALAKVRIAYAVCNPELAIAEKSKAHFSSSLLTAVLGTFFMEVQLQKDCAQKLEAYAGSLEPVPAVPQQSPQQLQAAATETGAFILKAPGAATDVHEVALHTGHLAITPRDSGVTTVFDAPIQVQFDASGIIRTAALTDANWAALYDPQFGGVPPPPPSRAELSGAWSNKKSTCRKNTTVCDFSADFIATNAGSVAAPAFTISYYLSATGKRDGSEAFHHQTLVRKGLAPEAAFRDRDSPHVGTTGGSHAHVRNRLSAGSARCVRGILIDQPQ